VGEKTETKKNKGKPKKKTQERGERKREAALGARSTRQGTKSGGNPEKGAKERGACRTFLVGYNSGGRGVSSVVPKGEN